MYNLATNLERNATFLGHNTALIFQDKTISYRQLNAMVNQVANQLIKLGIKPDEKVAISCPNTPAFVVGYYAIQKK